MKEISPGRLIHNLLGFQPASCHGDVVHGGGIGVVPGGIIVTVRLGGGAGWGQVCEYRGAGV